jgi:putative ATPase
VALAAAHQAILDATVQTVPLYLKDKGGQANKRLGQSKDYLYSHDFPEGISPQKYLIKPLKLYTPKLNGAEKVIAERLEHWKKLKEAL